MNVFLKYTADNGYTVTLPQKIRNKRIPYIPYIFTEDEMIRFFKICDTIPPYPGSQKHIIIPVLFRLLYGCGLRSSEITNLKCIDIDLDKGVITIRDAKFGKDRWVPLSSSLLKIMQQYSAQMNHSCGESGFFFRSKNLKPISRHWIYRRFRRILWASKISHMGKGKGPRVHDLRYPNLNKIQTFYKDTIDSECFHQYRFGFFSNDI